MCCILNGISKSGNENKEYWEEVQRAEALCVACGVFSFSIQ